MIDYWIVVSKEMAKRQASIYKKRRKILSYKLPIFVFLSIALIFFSPLFTSIMYAAPLRQVIAQSTTPTKTANSNSFLSYENNSTLGIKMQYPSNWQRDSYNNKVAFFAPSIEEGNRKIIPVALFVDVDTMPFQVTSLDKFISQYVDNLRKNASITEPIGVNLTSLAGNVAHNVTFTARIGQDVYHATNIIMLSGIKKYEITYYVAQQVKSSSYIPTIHRMIDSFEINIDMIKSTMKGTTGSSWFLTYENNSTLGLKIKYPSNWKVVEYGNTVVVFLSPSERNSDRFLEGFSITETPSNNKSLGELANQSIANYRQKYANFQLIGSSAITLKGSPAYMLRYQYTDQLFGKAMAMDIGMTKGGKLYVLSYSAEPVKFYGYLPTIQRMIDSFKTEGQNSNESRNDPSNSELA
jgi:hypothetical protein